MAGAIESTKDAKGKEKIATRVAYGKTLLELGKENPNIVVLDADLSGSTQTKFFAKEIPERFLNMGIAEGNMISVAAGLARAGKIPFASSFAMFACGRAWEQVRNSVAHNHLNVKVCATHSGLTVGEDGASHQIVEDIAIMRVIPTMTVIVPADAKETEKVIRAVAKYDGPCYVRLGRSALPVLFEDDYNFEIGKANVIREGTDISIIACGIMVSKALEAAEKLQEKGINAEVINCASIKPIDRDTIVKSVSKTKKVITAEEHNIQGGLGDAVSSVLAEDLNGEGFKFKRIGVQDSFGRSGKADELLELYGLTANHIVDEAIKL